MLKYINTNNSNNSNFYPIFHINNLNLNYMQNFENFKNLGGAIFIVDKSNVDFNKLMFLKNLVLYFHLNLKKIGVWNLPYCFEKYVYGNFDYVRFSNFLIQPNFLFFNLFHSINSNSIQLNQCKYCEMSKTCLGLGSKKENWSLWDFRLKSEYRAKISTFKKFQDEKIQQKHLEFIEYIKNSSVRYADRSIHYSSTYNKKSILNFSQRFIYYAHYIPPSEINSEFSFFQKNISSNPFVILLKEIYSSFYLTGFAYSFAYKDEFVRETFYIFPVNEEFFLEFINKNIHFNLTLNNFEDYYFLGLDFKENVISGIKVYTKVSNYELFIDFILQAYNVDISFLAEFEAYNYLYVRRINSKLEEEGFKIEVKINKKKNIIRLLEYLDFTIDENKFNNKYISRIALDYDLNGNLNKVNIYYSLPLNIIGFEMK